MKMGGETGAQREPSENFSEGSRWAPNAQPEPHFRREDGVGVKTGVKMGVKKLFNNPVKRGPLLCQRKLPTILVLQQYLRLVVNSVIMWFLRA